MFGNLDAVIVELQKLRSAVENNTKESNALRQELIRCQETLKDVRVAVSK